MTDATYRVNRTDAYGNKLAPMDYTDKAQALAHVRQAELIGLESALQTFDPMTGEFVDTPNG